MHYHMTISLYRVHSFRMASTLSMLSENDAYAVLYELQLCIAIDIHPPSPSICGVNCLQTVYPHLLPQRQVNLLNHIAMCLTFVTGSTKYLNCRHIEPHTTKHVRCTSEQCTTSPEHNPLCKNGLVSGAACADCTTLGCACDAHHKCKPLVEHKERYDSVLPAFCPKCENRPKM
ncbi:hypothetical protein K439DRAFT_518436 [Ramaria rubella]|nr:hypothetical protein K439DRAFT_518436 [Ramaria rubella]